ncbi:MAG: hypothetical protein EOO02_12115 [Chitinophagaceae bacterium]|nr:MAG: hypothetical protein EOO02_12115 [Chitinophagaceae bacterium]
MSCLKIVQHTTNFGTCMPGIQPDGKEFCTVAACCIFAANPDFSKPGIFVQNRLYTLICCLFLTQFPFSGTSQPGEQTPVDFQIAAHYGFFMANQPKAYYLQTSHTRMLEFTASKRTTGNRQWEAENSLPTIGLSGLISDLGSKEYLGKMAALFPFVHFPLKRSKNSITTFRLGTGVGWVEKPFDKNTNYKNLMIGSHLNAVISLKLQQEWKLSDQLYANLAIGFTHLSNGAMKLPNLGLNIPTLSVGTRYQSKTGTIPFTKRQLRRDKHIDLTILGSFALKQTYPLEHRAHLVKLVTAEVSKFLSPVSSFTAGVTCAYDPSLSKEITFVQAYEFDKSELQMQASVFAGYEHHVGKISFPVQLGTYVYNNYKASSLYQVIGVRYHWSPKWFAAVQLKAHFGKADYIQSGIAYKIS